MACLAGEGHRACCDESSRSQKSSPINPVRTIAHLDAVRASIDNHAAQYAVRLVDLSGASINGCLPTGIEGFAENDDSAACHASFAHNPGIGPVHDPDVIGPAASIQLRNRAVAYEDLASEIR